MNLFNYLRRGSGSLTAVPEKLELSPSLLKHTNSLDSGEHILHKNPDALAKLVIGLADEGYATYTHAIGDWMPGLGARVIHEFAISGNQSFPGIVTITSYKDFLLDGKRTYLEDPYVSQLSFAEYDYHAMKWALDTSEHRPIDDLMQKVVQRPS